MLGNILFHFMAFAYMRHSQIKVTEHQTRRSETLKNEWEPL